MKYLRTAIDNYLPEVITAIVIVAISLLILNDDRFLFVFSGLSIGAVLAFAALKFPTIPLQLILVLGLGDEFIYDLYDIRFGGVGILLTDPVYVVIYLAMVIAILRDPAILSSYWSYLRGGIFLGLVYFVLLVVSYMEHSYSALAEFRYHHIALFIPFYCLCLNLSTSEWIRFLRWTFWLCALGVIPLVIVSIVQGAEPFNPQRRILGSGTHTWLMASLFLLAVPGLVARTFAQGLIAWVIGAGYVLVILSDGHRSVWLTSAAILAAIWCLDRGEFRTLRIIAASLCLIALPLIAVVLFEGQTGISEFIISRTSAYFSPGEDGTASWRMWLWGGAWQIFLENPVLGIGLGSYFEDVWLLLTGQPEGASLHNLYITLLLKGGLVLMAAYFWYVCSIGSTLAKLRKNADHRLVAYVNLGLAMLVGMLVFQVPYGVSTVLMVFTGSLLAMALTGIGESGQDGRS